MSRARLFSFTLLAMIAFAANTVLSRLALEETATRAAVVQLSVPVIAALAGVVLVSEPITFRLVIASAAILGGIALVVVKR